MSDDDDKSRDDDRDEQGGDKNDERDSSSDNGKDDTSEDEQDSDSGKSGTDDDKKDGKESDKNDSDNDGSDDDQEDGKKKKSLFKKPMFWIIAAIVVAVIVVAAVLYYLHARQYESTDDAFVDAHLVRIAPQVSGTLVAVADVDNRHVKAGTLLAIVQPTGPEAELAESRANVIQAIAQEKQAEAQVAAAIATRNQTAEQARSPLADAVKARQDLARYDQLIRLDRSAVAGQQVDQARAQARSTNAEAAAAQRQISNADAQVAVAKRQVAAAKAMIEARRAQVRQSQVTLGNARLTAPINGQVVNRSVNLGSYVGPGTQLMAIVPDTMWITANFKETQLALMRIGQPVSIRVDAFPDVEFLGHVDSIQRGAGQAFALLPPQNATGNYVKVVQRVPVRITFDIKNGPDPRKYAIGPGMSVVPTVKVR